MKYISKTLKCIFPFPFQRKENNGLRLLTYWMPNKMFLKKQQKGLKTLISFLYSINFLPISMGRFKNLPKAPNALKQQSSEKKAVILKENWQMHCSWQVLT